MTISKKLLWLATCAAIAPVGVSTAHAQSTASVQELVVTAQRREERLFDVPIAINAASGEQLQAQGIVSVHDLAAIAPGLTPLQQGFAFQPTIRGIGTQSTQPGDEANVAMYIDNVYIPWMLGNAFNLKSVERIEVLKGPQGTLFGRNATGGAIRIVTKSPSEEFEALMSADYGFRLNSREFNAWVGGPIAPTLRASLEGYYYKDDGFIENLTPIASKVNDTEETTFRAKVIWEPTDWAKLTLAGDSTFHKSSLPFATTAMPSVAGQVLAFKNVSGALLIPDPEVDSYRSSLTFVPYHKTRAEGVSLTGEFQAPGHSVTATSSYRKFRAGSIVDTDRTNLDLVRTQLFTEGEALSHELDIASTFEGPLSYVAGVFYFWSDNRSYDNRNFVAPLSPVNPATGLRTVLGPLAPTGFTGGDQSGRSISVFGELTYRFTEQFSLIGGYRYTSEKKIAANWQKSINFTSNPGRETWTNSSFRATAKYDVNENLNAYVTVSTGFKSGLFALSTLASPASPNMVSVEPEKVTAYEVGSKWRYGILSLNASAFMYDYKNIQLQSNNILNPLQLSILQNAADSKIRGADADAQLRLADRLNVNLGVSYIPKAEYTNFPGGQSFTIAPGGLGLISTTSNLGGTRMIRTPKLQVTAGVNYEFDFYEGEAGLNLSYYYSSSFLWVPGTYVGLGAQPSYSTVNAKARWTQPNGKVTYSVWAHNLLGEVYYQSASISTGGIVGTYAKPRDFGVGVSAKF
jgi:iron complex outermembrane receptor protein